MPSQMPSTTASEPYWDCRPARGAIPRETLLTDQLSRRWRPMSAITRPERRILRVTDLMALLGLSRTTIWRMRRVGEIPQPIRIGANAIGWPDDVIAEWLAKRPKA